MFGWIIIPVCPSGESKFLPFLAVGFSSRLVDLPSSAMALAVVGAEEQNGDRKKIKYCCWSEKTRKKKKEISKSNLQPLCVLVGGLKVAGCGC